MTDPVRESANFSRRYFPLEGGVNFRDLGGYPVEGARATAWNTLYRSGTLHALSTADWRQLQDLGLAAAFDLRSQAERAERPHGFAGRSPLSYFSIDHDHDAGDLGHLMTNPKLSVEHVHGWMLKSYRQMPYDLSPSLRALFSLLVRGPLPLVFNCSAGKDRTGVAAALILISLGVPWNVVVADYLISATTVRAQRHLLQSARAGTLLGALEPATVEALLGTEPIYLEAMRESIEKRSGSMENYLRDELTLREEDLRTLRSRLLAGSDQ
jgi:protein-tyrosine phosphatase